MSAGTDVGLSRATELKFLDAAHVEEPVSLDSIASTRSSLRNMCGGTAKSASALSARTAIALIENTMLGGDTIRLDEHPLRVEMSPDSTTVSSTEGEYPSRPVVKTLTRAGVASPRNRAGRLSVT